MKEKKIVLKPCPCCRRTPGIEREGSLKRVACIDFHCHSRPKTGWRYRLGSAKRTWNEEIGR